MENFLNSFLDAVDIRHNGPMSFRIIIQPLVSLVYAVIAGIKDAKADKPPFLKALILGKASRRDLLKELWKDVGKIFILATVLEIIFELIVFKTVHPLEVLRVGFFLAILPYLIMRGPVERIVHLFIKKDEDKTSESSSKN
ncbi:MAG TPA: hypothetical protein PKA90_02495 [Ignavibacteria bacterium]|nr:hypothetical protein [Ignavibacteria bacterium]HMR39277.1 hypothetical protein [Ignavibacteria bacterium]